MKTSEVFKLAKAKLKTGSGKTGERYICYALSRVNAPHQDIRNAKRIVQYLLKGCVSLEAWLYHKHNIGVNFFARESAKKMQATRQAWLDHLIEHYEAQGD